MADGRALDPALVVTVPPTRLPERRYVLDTVLGEFLGIPFRLEIGSPGTTSIALAAVPNDARIVMPDRLLALDESVWLTEDSLRSLQLQETKVADTPVLAMFPGDAPAARSSEWLPFDLLGAIFFCLTRYEEYVTGSRDAFERPLPQTLPVASVALSRPLVNEYVEALWQLLVRLAPGLERKRRAYKLEPSHDVDEFSLKGRTARSVALSLGADLLQRREPRLAVRRAAAYVATSLRGREVEWDPYLTFDFLMDVSERCNLRSTFFFVSRHTDEAMDPRYDIEDPAIGKTIARIAARGHEIGLHGSFNSSVIDSALATELETLKAVCRRNGVEQEQWGARQHCLRLRVPATWRAMADAGIAYDASLGFAPRPGFRAACCYEYPVWDLEAGEQLPLRERPLVAMEVSFFTYQRKTLDEAASDIESLAATCRRYGGVMTLLWHNHWLASKRSRNVYRELVDAIS